MCGTDRRHSRRSPRGLGLAETLVVCFIFTLISGLCVLASITGFRMFSQTNARQALQRDAGAVFAWLERDIESSNLTFNVVESRMVDTNHRDRLAVGGLGSWTEPIKTDGMGHPAWDRVVVYEATRETEDGQLLRKVTDVAASRLPLTTATVVDIMTNVGSTFDVRRLAGGVRNFEVIKSVGLESVQVKMILTQRTTEVGSHNARTEVLEVQSSVRPRNTFPRL